MTKRVILGVALALAVALPVSAQNRAPELRQTWQEIAEMISAAGRDDAAARILESVSAATDQDLETVYGQADLGVILDALAKVEAAVQAAEAVAGDSVPLRSWIASQSFGFEGNDLPPLGSPGIFDIPDYPDPIYCPSSPDRSDSLALQIAVDAIQAARIALEGVKVVWSGLSRLCDQVVVVCPVPGGGNTSTLCIAADVVLFAAELVVGAAEGVVEHFEFCDGEVDSAEIEGTWEKVGHIHTDLDEHNTGISTQLTNHNAAISTQLTNHNAAISIQLTTHDTDISNQLVAHDADIKTLLGNVQDTADENQRLIKIFMSRQLEIMRLLITPDGGREINEDVLTCTGDDCPLDVQLCPNGSLKWNCRK